MDWQDQAACKNADVHEFYGNSNNGKQGMDLEKNLPGRYKYCLPSMENNHTECPVRLACLETALRIREQHGIWGGLTSVERRKLVRQRRLNAS